MVYQFPRGSITGRRTSTTCSSASDWRKALPLAVEFRHGSWLAPKRAASVFDFLTKNDITYVAADEPQYGTLATVPFIPRVTTDFAYFRFHGRNAENWLKRNVETSLRYAYSYSDAELHSFVPAVKEADRQAKADLRHVQ